ncbi:MAG: monovalent cation/H(+) antiporter subunit G [Nitrospirae bacterium]|nr:monovalent cation/H(+) antiporter subunit G [Fimbriimonadaceae bacterium]
MKEALTVVLLMVGSVFALIAAIGVVKMPDVYMRMQSATKATTLGIGCVMLATAVHFQDTAVWTRALLVVLFIFMTSPVGAHMLSRAAYLTKVPLWQGTILDELEGRYDTEDHELDASPEANEEGA